MFLFLRSLGLFPKLGPHFFILSQRSVALFLLPVTQSLFFVPGLGVVIILWTHTRGGFLLTVCVFSCIHYVLNNLCFVLNYALPNIYSDQTFYSMKMCNILALHAFYNRPKEKKKYTNTPTERTNVPEQTNNNIILLSNQRIQ